MSYRELRDFCEHLRVLGYNRPITINAFVQPNFPLIADLYAFLLKRFDPSVVHSEDIDTPKARVAFIQNLTVLAQAKCSIKLSMKSLYRADGFAVRELSKLSSMLYKAVIQSNRERQNDPGHSGIQRTASNSSPANQLSIPNISLDEFKQARSLAPELIELGERLSSALARDVELRQHRDASLAFVDSLSIEPGIGGINPVERTIRKQLELMADNVRELSTLTVSLNTETSKLSEKVSKRDAELDRMEKRFRALKRVRPAFADEYDNAEREVRSVYDTYVTALRNLRFLQSELDGLRSEEQEQKDEQDRQMKRMQKRLKQEELRILRGDANQDDDDDDDDLMDQSDQSDDDNDDDMVSDSDNDSQHETKQPRNPNSRFKDDDQSDADDDDLAFDQSDDDEEVSDSDGGDDRAEESKYNYAQQNKYNQSIMQSKNMRPNMMHSQHQQLSAQHGSDEDSVDVDDDDDDDDDQF